MNDQFTHDSGKPQTLRQGTVETKEDDRLTFQLMGQYLQWNAPATTIQFGTSRLVDESCSPFTWHGVLPEVGLDLGKMAQASMPGRKFDVWVLNKTGWKHHTPPSRVELARMTADGTAVALEVDGVRAGAPIPGGIAVLPNATEALRLVPVGPDRASVSVYVFPY